MLLRWRRGAGIMTFVKTSERMSAVIPPAIATVLPALVAGVLFAGSLQGGFVYDDRVLVTHQPLIRDLSALGLHDIFTHQDYSRYSPHYLPIRLLSYAVDYRLWGLDPFGFHLTNLLLHVMNTMLVALFTMRVAGTVFKEDGGRVVLAGGAAALLFAAHPLQAETVAWISGRKDLLSTGFALCAALLYLRSFLRPVSKKTDWSKLGSLAFFALSMLSMAASAALPLVFLAFEIFLKPGAGQEKIVRRLERLLPLFAVDAAILCMDMKLSVKSDLLSTWIGGSAFTHYITVAGVPLFYIGKVIWPAPLCVEYSIHAQKVLLSPLVICSILFWAGFAGWLTMRGRKTPGAAVLAAWAVLSLAPVMSLLPTGKLVADRYFYMPAAGMFGLVGYLTACAVFGRGAIVRAATLGMLLLFAGLFAVKTSQRIPDWRSEMALWMAALEVEPENAVVFQNLGYAYYEQRDYKRAEKYFGKAIERDPHYAPAYINLGVLEQQVWGRTDEAIRLFRKALKIDPNNAIARADLALALFDKGAYGAAIKEMALAAESDPGDLSIVRKLEVMRNIFEEQNKSETTTPDTPKRMESAD